MMRKVGVEVRPDLTIEGVACGKKVGCGCSHSGKWVYSVVSGEDLSSGGSNRGCNLGGVDQIGLGPYWEVLWPVTFWKLRFHAAVEGGIVSAKARYKMVMMMIVVVWVVCRSYKDESQ
ncbi:unnamed protein product [Hymenolepis diminuta]|uniref:Uncharacterized protein n=1 Tax=Hymenolepis diminuta TaxID=6216 RepID=A0A564YW24_HYMDI|nr:unnamed protein product [Hymenolepis diminuta]VUZ50893.1 unnamed protein product [Hymenolepis diminuta]